MPKGQGVRSLWQKAFLRHTSAGQAGVSQQRSDVARAAREAGHRRPRHRPARHRWIKVRLVAASSVLIAGISMVHPASTWLRRHGVPVPYAHLTPSMWLVAWLLLFALFSVFVAVELTLLIKAIKTVEDPVLHERYKALMLHWPYALLTPYTIFKTNVLPRVFFGSDERHGADTPVAPAAAEQLDPVTRDEYRSALALVIGQIDSMTTDRELRDLLLEKYQSLESTAEGRFPASSDQVPVRLPKARISNRWTDSQLDAWQL